MYNKTALMYLEKALFTLLYFLVSLFKTRYYAFQLWRVSKKRNLTNGH